MSSDFGKTLRVGVFGESHGAAIGVTVDGLPAGERIDMDELQAFLDRRRPGKNPLSTMRRETDVPEFLSGLRDGVTCGTPLCAVIYNSDQHSADYAELADKPRPSHADYTAWVKWRGQADMRGGGHFSGRLTAPLCVAGGIAGQILARRGIFVGAHLAAVGTEEDETFPLHPTDELFRAVAAKPFPTLSDAAGERMQRVILDAREAQDSVGGIIECAAIGLPAGVGEPMFDGVENGRKVNLSVRSESFVLDENGPIACEVTRMYQMGKEEMAYLRMGECDFRAYIDSEEGLKPGDQVHLALKKRGVFLFDRETGERIR